MASEVDICNSALDKLGVESINSLTDNNNRAKICNRNYPIIRDEVLRSHPWKFALKRIVLSSAVTTPAFGYEKEFILPADCLRVWQVGENNSCKWTEENGKLLYSADSAEILYISRVPVGKFDSSFIETLAYRLAIQMCYSITQSTPRQQELKAEFLVFQADARSFSAQSAQQTTYIIDSYLDVRY